MSLDPSAVASRRLIAFLWVLALALGLLHAWGVRHAARPDTVSYLDMGTAMAGGDWRLLLNRFWSPLYPALLGAAMWILRPSPDQDFALVHLVDFFVYAGALGCFHFLMSGLAGHNRSRSPLPAWAWWMLGYALFIWSSLGLILRGAGGTPDLCVAAFVYLAAGCLLRIRSDAPGWKWFALFGVVLGLGCLAKTILFPMAFVFLAVGLAAAGLRAVPRLLLSLGLFLAVAGPYVAAVSTLAGRLTFGDSGRLNYAWWINGVTPPFVHWQGSPPGSGTPLHPTRKILDSPAVFEFAAPIPGTYPPWLDLGYWHEGVAPHFELRGQVRILLTNTRIYFELLLRQGALLAGFLALTLCSGRGRQCVPDVAGEWILLAPGLAGLLLYWPVYAEWRYVGPFVVLLWMACFSGVRLDASPEAKRVFPPLAIAMAACLLLEIGGLTAYDLSGARSRTARPHWTIAERLRSMGLQPGDRVGFIGRGPEAYWARLARLRIIAEIPQAEAGQFWAAPDTVRSRALQAFASTPARAIVTESAPLWASTAGWRSLEGTGAYVYWLR